MSSSNEHHQPTSAPSIAGAADGNVAGNNYDKYASTNPIEKRMMNGFFDALDACLEGLTPRTVVEVGAGEGRVIDRLAQRFANSTVIGLDLPDEALATDWDDLDLPMFFGDATRLPFRDRSIDLVVALEVLEHVPNPAAARRELARVCKHAVFSVPREPIWRAGNVMRGRYVRSFGNTPGHINHWSARGFRRFLRIDFDIDAHRNPLPWTMVRATPRRAN